MKFWKEIDKNANEGNTKVIISDNILKRPDVCIYEHPGDLLNKFQKILPSSGICFKDDDDVTKLFSVIVDGVHIENLIDDLCFTTGNDEYEIATSILSGSVETELDCADIIFHKGLVDLVFIDIDPIEDHIILHINTCKNSNEVL